MPRAGWDIACDPTGARVGGRACPGKGVGAGTRGVNGLQGAP